MTVNRIHRDQGTFTGDGFRGNAQNEQAECHMKRKRQAGAATGASVRSPSTGPVAADLSVPGTGG